MTTKKRKIFNIVNTQINLLYGCSKEQLYNKKSEKSMYFNFKQLYFVRIMTLDILKKYLTIDEIHELTKLSKYIIQNSYFYYTDIGLLKIRQIINDQILI